MLMSSFGSVQMSIIPKEKDPSTMELVIVAENRKDVIRMDLQKGEDVAMFCKRIHSMLRGLMSAELRVPEQAQVAATTAAQIKTFEEVKAALTGQKAAAPVRA